MSQIRLFIGLLLIAFAAADSMAADQPCAATPAKPMGNNHIANVAPFKVNVGKGLTLKGRVLSATNCQPIADAVIEHWQAGNLGTYEKHLRAFTFSLPDGSYELETEWPNMPVPHIHFIVTADHHSKLITQWIPGNKTESTTFDLILKPAFSL